MKFSLFIKTLPIILLALHFDNNTKKKHGTSITDYLNICELLDKLLKSFDELYHTQLISVIFKFIKISNLDIYNCWPPNELSTNKSSLNELSTNKLSLNKLSSNELLINHYCLRLILKLYDITHHNTPYYTTYHNTTHHNTTDTNINSNYVFKQIDCNKQVAHIFHQFGIKNISITKLCINAFNKTNNEIEIVKKNNVETIECNQKFIFPAIKFCDFAYFFESIGYNQCIKEICIDDVETINFYTILINFPNLEKLIVNDQLIKNKNNVNRSINFCINSNARTYVKNNNLMFDKLKYFELRNMTDRIPTSLLNDLISRMPNLEIVKIFLCYTCNDEVFHTLLANTKITHLCLNECCVSGSLHTLVNIKLPNLKLLHFHNINKQKHQI
jgi:hypothetical protein